MALPIVLAGLGGVLINSARHMAMQVLIAVGVSVVTYQGMDTAITWAKSQAIASIMGLPPDYANLLSYLGVGRAINIIFSAMVMRMTLQGINGAFKRFQKS
jgi:hypothetical protein